MVYELIRYIFYIFLLYVAYFIYYFVIKLYVIREMSKKHKNVFVSQKFIPLLGDAAVYMENINRKRYMLWEHIHMAVHSPEFDIKLESKGSKIRYYMASIEAAKQFKELIPHKLDRADENIRSFGKLNPLAFLNRPSTQNFKDRRNAVTSTIGLNFVSQYIPLMIS